MVLVWRSPSDAVGINGKTTGRSATRATRTLRGRCVLVVLSRTRVLARRSDGVRIQGWWVVGSCEWHLRWELVVEVIGVAGGQMHILQGARMCVRAVTAAMPGTRVRKAAGTAMGAVLTCS